MDAKTIYNLLKPHLELMESSEKRSLSNLISGMGVKESSGGHRRTVSITKAKENLKTFCQQQMELEQKPNNKA